MTYLAVLGRIPELSLAELRALYGEVVAGQGTATFLSETEPDIDRLGGTIKLGREIAPEEVLEFLLEQPEGKIVLGVSDYSHGATAKTAQNEGIRLKKLLREQGRSARVVANKTAMLSAATCLHNGLGRRPRHVELIITERGRYIGLGAQNIEAYAARDQKRPFRDARVGMLPPKLAQILINLCGPLPSGARILDPFCGTGVVLQEAMLMGYTPYGTDKDARMVEYSQKNLRWARKILDGPAEGHAEPGKASISAARPWRRAEPTRSEDGLSSIFSGDATEFSWEGPIDAVACETYLGPPMSQVPGELKLRDAKMECSRIILGFLRNLSGQVKPGTPVVLAVPRWLRTDGSYSGLNILDEIEKMGYNREKDLGSDLLYFRKGQIVAREILILRKK